MDEMKPETPRKNTTRRAVLWTLLGLVLAGLVLGGMRLHRVLNRPETLFAAATAVPTQAPLQSAFPVAEPTPSPTPAGTTAAPASPAPTGTDAPTPTALKNTEATEPTPPGPSPTPEPEAAPAGPHMLNVMLMGIDAYENGGTTSGSMPHTDVMMVIAVNFDRDTVDLITLPRDIMTTAPDHYGIYKLNGVFNVGLGGWTKPVGQADELAAGFLLTCRAAEAWLGGISIPYYYGLDFQAVIDIVDAIGGIDYDVDQKFTSQSGRKVYQKGMHHLDGDAVMGYLRIRQSADGLDSSRTARQRRMLVAIFNKLKTEGKLSQVPSLISAATSGIYTNTTLSQTTALVNYAMNLSSDSIRTRAMFGEISTIEFDWRYVYVDQQNRLDLIREVYGIEAEPVGIDTRQYERWLHDVGFSAMKHLRQAEKVLKKVQERKDAGDAFTDEQIALYGDCYRAYTALRAGFDEATDTLTRQYVDAPWREKKTGRSRWTDENKARDKELTRLEKTIRQDLDRLKADSKAATRALADAVGVQGLTWNVGAKWFDDPDINEVIVKFG